MSFKFITSEKNKAYKHTGGDAATLVLSRDIHASIVPKIRSAVVKRFGTAEKDGETNPETNLDESDVRCADEFITARTKTITLHVPRPERLVGRQGAKLWALKTLFPRLVINVARKTSKNPREVNISYSNPATVKHLLKTEVFREANEQRAGVDLVIDGKLETGIALPRLNELL